jgi:hypothetical protein
VWILWLDNIHYCLYFSAAKGKKNTLTCNLWHPFNHVVNLWLFHQRGPDNCKTNFSTNLLFPSEINIHTFNSNSCKTVWISTQKDYYYTSHFEAQQQILSIFNLQPDLKSMPFCLRTLYICFASKLQRKPIIFINIIYHLALTVLQTCFV